MTRDENGYFIYRHVVSLQETNLVGNVYFAHFAAWQGRCREMFLKVHAPSVLADLSSGLKLVTTSLRLDFAAELFAFEEIEIRMRLKGLRGHRIAMAFEYVVMRNGVSLIAAQGEQEVACFIAGQAAGPPSGFLEALQKFSVN